jgi:hypothetical protein
LSSLLLGFLTPYPSPTPPLTTPMLKWQCGIGPDASVQIWAKRVRSVSATSGCIIFIPEYFTLLIYTVNFVLFSFKYKIHVGHT